MLGSEWRNKEEEEECNKVLVCSCTGEGVMGVREKSVRVKGEEVVWRTRDYSVWVSIEPAAQHSEYIYHGRDLFEPWSIPLPFYL